MTTTGALRCEWLGRIDYRSALARQETLVAGKTRRSKWRPGYAAPAGARPGLHHRAHAGPLQPLGALPHPVETINRGGQATYHGPGQLVGYPILDLARRGRDLHRYLRALEELLIARAGPPRGRRDGGAKGLTGVWAAENRKIASIGVGVRRWVSQHGFALNVAGGEALAPFRAITPCGLADVTMTSLETEGGVAGGVEAFAETVRDVFLERLDGFLPLTAD